MKRYIPYLLIFWFFALQAKAQDEIHSAVVGNGVRVSNPIALNTFLPGTLPMIHPGQEPFFYPNPATDHIWLVLSPLVRKIYTTTFYDDNKKVLSEQEYVLDPGEHQVSIALPTYDPASTLLLRVEESGNPNIQTFRIFRQ